MNERKLWNKDFILVALGQIISLFGNGILRFALPLYLLRETNSPALFGLVTACAFLPMILLSFMGGILADRVNKRNIMVILDFITSLIVFTVLLLLGKVALVPLLIVVLMLLYGISGTYQPAVQASIPALVGSSKILSAGAVINQIGALSGLLGPIIGGMLFGTFGIYPILIISAICFFLSAVMELFIHIPHHKRPNTQGCFSIIRSDLRDSISYLKKEKPLLIRIIGLVVLLNLVLSSLMTVAYPILVVDTLDMSDSMLGLTQGALALGGLGGGIFAGAMGSRLSLRQSPVLLTVCSLSLAMLSLPLLFHSAASVCFWVLTAGGFLIMACATIFSVQMIAAVQVETPPELVGKVIALMLAVSMCAQPLGQAVYGAIFQSFPAHTGVILLAAALLSVLLSAASVKIFKGVPRKKAALT